MTDLVHAFSMSRPFDHALKSPAINANEGSREEVISRFVALKCEALMFAKPSEYIDKLAKVLAKPLDVGLVSAFIEIKASRDIIIHNNGRINKLFVEKAGDKARGKIGDELKVEARNRSRHSYRRRSLAPLLHRFCDRMESAAISLAALRSC
ncbi:hypothetical protein KZJ38_07285 [Paraburkholderia edwinii]|uniref:Uncharacterized protein n=1 Tax=Paraburkholderia edwinii TaxID=2861782 RepID=A0ABX8UN28_9BURK|nr:hypothetical protein [Paraburkholderia edwinii]QYD70106.1 hypothetical protein KZJ38_07285 [Paraburkholderia edwinii]